MSYEERLQFCCESDVGRSREENEDNYGLLSPQDSKAGWLFLVADGMGGAAAGRTASEMAVRVIREQYTRLIAERGTGDIFSCLVLSIERANKALLEHSRDNPECRGMGTTITAAAVFEDKVYTAHVGDSRIYRFRQGRLERLMRDHTRVQLLADQGIITPAEANTHPEGHVIIRNLGGQYDVEVDIPEDGPFALGEGDVYLLCSDGLHGLVEDDAIRRVISAAPPATATPGLIKLANTMGGYDNITVCLVCAGQGPEAWGNVVQEDFDALLDELALDVNSDTGVFAAQEEAYALGPMDFDTQELRTIQSGGGRATSEVHKIVRSPSGSLKTADKDKPRPSLQHTVAMPMLDLSSKRPASAGPAPASASKANEESLPASEEGKKGPMLLVIIALVVVVILLIIVLIVLGAAFLGGSTETSPVETSWLIISTCIS